MGYADPVIDPYNQARLLYLVQPEEEGEPLVLLYQGLSSHERGEVLICCSDLIKTFSPQNEDLRMYIFSQGLP